jgi:hypothetical protein
VLSRNKLPGLGSLVPGPDNVTRVFIFLGSVISVKYKLTLSDPAQVTLKMRAGISDLVSRF